MKVFGAAANFIISNSHSVKLQEHNDREPTAARQPAAQNAVSRPVLMVYVINLFIIESILRCVNLVDILR